MLWEMAVFPSHLPDPKKRIHVKYTYPDSIADATIARSVPLFCFPEETITISKKYNLLALDRLIPSNKRLCAYVGLRVYLP